MAEKDKTFIDFVKKYKKELWVGFLLLLLVIFLVQNSHDVKFRVLFLKMELPLILLILSFAALGAAIVGVYWVISNRDKKAEIKMLNKALEKAGSDLAIAKRKNIGKKDDDEADSTSEADDEQNS